MIGHAHHKSHTNPYGFYTMNNRAALNVQVHFFWQTGLCIYYTARIPLS